MKKWYAVPAMILGSFAVYCSQSVVSDHGFGPNSDSGMLGDGPVSGDAHAQSAAACCKPAVPKFKLLAQLAAGASKGTKSADADLDGYVDYVLQTECTIEMDLKVDEASTWVRGTYGSGGRFPLRARYMRLVSLGGCDVPVILAGVKLEVPG